MPRSEAGRSGRRSRTVLRVLSVVLAAVMGIVAIWLIVTAGTTKRAQIGALLGFWALLLAAYPMLGTRHPRADAGGAEPGGAEAGGAEAGQALDVRPQGRLERSEDAAERLEYERRLQLMVRHEIQSALGSELADLRTEVAALRTEILEKVGGQIRLERIETTRMVGSNIEALKREVRLLKGAERSDELFDLDSSTTFVSSIDDAAGAGAGAGAGPGAGDPAVYNAATEPVPSVKTMPPAQMEPPAQPVPPPQPVPAAEGLPPLQPVPAGEAPPWPQPGPLLSREVKGGEDPFASLPRIKPFTDFSLDEEDQPISAADNVYAGRRRQARETDVPFAPAGRHAGGEADWATASPTGGRRRRENSDEDDVLAKILERESTRH